jgi:hypothetical protein
MNGMSDDGDRRARTLALAQHRHEVGGHVRVRSEGQPPAGPRRHLLRDHVRAPGEHAARDVRVVDARIRLLGERGIEPGARLHEEFLHAHVRRQPARAQRRDPLGLRRVAVDPVGNRLDEPALQLARGPRTRERESRQDREFEARVRGGAAVEGVDQRDRLARADRRAQHDPAPHLREHVLDAGIDVREPPGRGAAHGPPASRQA